MQRIGATWQMFFDAPPAVQHQPLEGNFRERWIPLHDYRSANG
jgi:hypothetical protein